MCVCVGMCVGGWVVGCAHVWVSLREIVCAHVGVIKRDCVCTCGCH